MSANHGTRVVFRSPLLTISDHRCRPVDLGCSEEECAFQCEIVFPRSGLFVKHVGRRRIVGDCNRVLFFRTGEAYRVSHPVPGGDNCTAFSPHADVLREMIGHYRPELAERASSPLPVGEGPSEPRDYLAHRRLLACLSAPGGAEPIAVEEVVFAFLDRTLRGALQHNGHRTLPVWRATGQAHGETVEAVRTVLGERFRSRITLDALARAVHSSPFHLARVFRARSGVPIHRYQNRLRLRASLERLADGQENLTELALDLGYASHSHFTDAFRREFGTSPSAFRRSVTTRLLREMSKISEA